MRNGFLLILLTNGCVYGGEERTREDHSYSVSFVHWEAKLSDGTDAGSGCVLTNDKDSYGDYLVISAEAGATVQLSETFQRFRTTSEAWNAHSDDAYWCSKSGAIPWASIPNPRCWEPVDPEQAPAHCARSSFSMLETEIVPPREYPEAPYLEGADGFRLTLKLGRKGEQCVEDCSRGPVTAFTVE